MIQIKDPAIIFEYVYSENNHLHKFLIYRSTAISDESITLEIQHLNL